MMPHRRRSGKELVRFRDEGDNRFNRFFDLDSHLSRRLFGAKHWAPQVDLIEVTAKIRVKAG
jgi:HSP20 family protein